MVRQRFVRDDDGHDYLINVGQEDDFEQWMAYMEGAEGAEDPGVDFESLGTGVNNFTFVDAQEDE